MLQLLIEWNHSHHDDKNISTYSASQLKLQLPHFSLKELPPKIKLSINMQHFTYICTKKNKNYIITLLTNSISRNYLLIQYPCFGIVSILFHLSTPGIFVFQTWFWISLLVSWWFKPSYYFFIKLNKSLVSSKHSVAIIFVPLNFHCLNQADNFHHLYILHFTCRLY